jgi:hypothetical protein
VILTENLVAPLLAETLKQTRTITRRQRRIFAIEEERRKKKLMTQN